MAALQHVPGIAGVDEAGRGPLAGPVVVAAVMLPDEFDCTGIQDSKKLTAARRDALAERICATAQYAIEFVEPEEIDRLNILKATLAGMARALMRIEPRPQAAYIDGNHIPPVPILCSPMIKGDGRYAAIAAASILAKTTRDTYMQKMSAEYPGYGFEKHFGYPTAEHLEQLRHLGPSPIHRRSFRPVQEMVSQPCLAFVD